MTRLVNHEKGTCYHARENLMMNRETELEPMVTYSDRLASVNDLNGIRELKRRLTSR